MPAAAPRSYAYSTSSAGLSCAPAQVAIAPGRPCLGCLGRQYYCTSRGWTVLHTQSCARALSAFARQNYQARLLPNDHSVFTRTSLPRILLNTTHLALLGWHPWPSLQWGPSDNASCPQPEEGRLSTHHCTSESWKAKPVGSSTCQKCMRSSCRGTCHFSKIAVD